LLNYQEHLEEIMANRTDELMKANEMLKTEIDERQLIMETLHYSEQQLFSMINSVPGAIYRCCMDEKWIFDSVSDYITYITGYPTSRF